MTAKDYLKSLIEGQRVSSIPVQLSELELLYQLIIMEQKMSTIYSPCNWQVIEVKALDGTKLHHRVLAGWSGSYLYGNSWKVSSGFELMFDLGDQWKVTQTSGSVYLLNKQSEHPSTATCGILEVLQENSKDVTIKVVTMESILQSYGIF